MLKNLHIENIAVIERADVEFSAGLNALTGETGAGKSIVIDALNAVLGGRTTRELVRTGTDKALATAVFDSAPAEEWCAENDIELDSDELILQRRISVDGKSSARVNGVPVSITQLRELGNLLLDIHGQNDGRLLLDEKRHLEYLDRFGTDFSVLEQYRNAFEEYRTLLAEKKQLEMDEGEKEHLAETLRYRIQELENAAIRPGEEEELSSRRDMLRNSEKLTEALEEAYTALYHGDGNAISLAGDAEYMLDRASTWCPDLAEAARFARDARLLLEDVAERVHQKQDELDFSPEEYNNLEERLALLHRLEKKYTTDEAGLTKLLEDSRKRYDDLEYAEDRLIKLEKETKEALSRAKAAAAVLSDARKASAAVLERRVEQELRDLSMPSVRFSVQIIPAELTSSGADDCSFLMSANAGQAPGPISRIASGGELSRIMLALKTVFAEKDGIPSLVFDEIDTGVSGIAAQRVGEKLAFLARSKQILCVTHLPQIAAMADVQLLVEKRERNGKTYTDLSALDRDGRCRELARLQSGENLTPTALSAAGEQLSSAEHYKKSLMN